MGIHPMVWRDGQLGAMLALGVGLAGCLDCKCNFLSFLNYQKNPRGKKRM
jgi:hypothetical protein